MKTKMKLAKINRWSLGIFFLVAFWSSLFSFSQAADKLTVGDEVWFFEKKEEGVRICGVAGEKGCVRTKVYLHRAIVQSNGADYVLIEPTKRYIFSYSPEANNQGVDDSTWNCAINVRRYCYGEEDFEGSWFSSGEYEEGEEHRAQKSSLVSGEVHIIQAVVNHYLQGNTGIQVELESGPEVASEISRGEKFYFPFKEYEIERGKHYLVNYFIGEATEDASDGKVKVKLTKKFPHAYNPRGSGIEKGYGSWEKRDCLHCYDENDLFSRFSTDRNYYDLYSTYELGREYELSVSEIYKKENLSQEKFVEKLVSEKFWRAQEASDEEAERAAAEAEQAAREFQERLSEQYGGSGGYCQGTQPSEGISGSPFTFNKSLVPCGRECDDGRTPYNEAASCTLCHLLILLKNLFDLAFALLIIVSIVFVTVAGLMYMFSGVNPGLKSTAKGILTKTLTGFGISMLSWLIVYTLLVFISVDQDKIGSFKKGEGWFQFTCDANSVFDGYEGGITNNIPPGTTGDGNAGSWNGGKYMGHFPAPPSEYQSDWPTPDTSKGIDSYEYQSGIRAQITKGDAAEELISFIVCMSDKLPKQAKVISSISDNYGMNKCIVSNYSSGCAHKKGSCHYGGTKCVGKSYAVDMAEEQYGDIINYAAIQCNSKAYVWGEGNHVHVSIGGANGCGCN